jgi:hypothetical protein
MILSKYIEYEIEKYMGIYEPDITIYNWTDTHGYIHRDLDQPAVIFSNGSKLWSQHGLVHRDRNQPELICDDGLKIWCRYDVVYRTKN